MSSVHSVLTKNAMSNQNCSKNREKSKISSWCRCKRKYSNVANSNAIVNPSADQNLLKYRIPGDQSPCTTTNWPPSRRARPRDWMRDVKENATSGHEPCKLGPDGAEKNKSKKDWTHLWPNPRGENALVKQCGFRMYRWEWGSFLGSF